jgi:hypothetical protein
METGERRLENEKRKGENIVEYCNINIIQIITTYFRMKVGGILL